MSRWADFQAAQPEFAERVAALFKARRHKVLATLRRDGSPRVSGIETEFENGELVLGMMDDSVKLQDVRRDPRIAIHATSDDPKDGESPTAWGGDAKVSGRLVGEAAIEGGPEGSALRLDITEVVFTKVGDPPDHLVIESWHESGGYRRRTRK